MVLLDGHIDRGTEPIDSVKTNAMKLPMRDKSASCSAYSASKTKSG